MWRYRPRDMSGAAVPRCWGAAVPQCGGASVRQRNDQLTAARQHRGTAALSRSCLAAGPLQVRAGVGGALARLAQLGADGTAAARRQLAGLLQGLPERQQLVGPG